MPLRVLMFGWEFPPHNSGGLGTACEGLATALTDRGVETIFVVPKEFNIKHPRVNVRSANIGALKVRAITSLIRPYIYNEEFARLYGVSLLDEVRLYGLRARELAKEENFDVIHAHDWLSFLAGVEAKRVSGRPLIVHVHATEFDRTGGLSVNQDVYEIERQGMHEADGIIAVSQLTKDMVVKHYGVPPGKIRVVHNGVEAYRPRLAPVLEAYRRRGNKIVLFVGRITLQKGPDYFVEVAKRVLEYEPATYFVMAGSGDMEGQIIRQVTDMGLARRFIFPGFVRGEELDQLYQSADLYILPSVSEPFGITPLESIANGTPVLISNQSGVAEVVSHALKTDFWDVDEMANQIVAALRYPALRETMANHGRREAQEITWAEAARKCFDFYRHFVPAGA